MKKSLVALGVWILLCATVSPLSAGGIINKSNLSADYFRSLTRHASTDAADIIPFNPAGVMKMENGIYTKLDILYINKDYGNNVPSSFGVPGGFGDLSSDEPSIVPGFFAVYKEDKWAGFFAVTVPGGGGKVDFSDGDARTALLGGGVLAQANQAGFGVIYTGIGSMSLEADSYAIGYTLGGAYEINDMFSVAGGIRYITAKQKFDGQVTPIKNSANPASASPLFRDQFKVELTRDATGLGYFLGLNVTPNEKLNLGFLYQSNTDLDYDSDVSRDDIGVTPLIGWADGTKEREDLPGILALGVSYMLTPKLRGEIDYTRYLESAADLENARFNEPGEVGDSWEVGLSLTYTFNPQWRASIGYLHTDIVGIEPDQMLVESPELDASTIGLGGVYSPTDRWDITFSYTNVTYDSVKTKDQTFNRAPSGTELEKAVTAFSVGFQYRF